MHHSWPALAALVALSAFAQAARGTDEPGIALYDGVLRGDVDLGFTQENKNVDSRKFRTSGRLVYEREKWRSLLRSDYNLETTENDTTADNFNVELQQDYRYTARRHSFVKLYYEDDEFSSFQYQLTGAVGYGYRVVENETQRLDLELAPGFRKDESVDGDAEVNPILLGQARYRHKLSDSAVYEQYAGVEASDNTIVRAESSLRLNVIGAVAMRLLVKYKYTQHVDPGLVNDEWESAVTMVYGF